MHYVQQKSCSTPISNLVSLLTNVHVGRRSSSSSSGPEATTGGGEGAQKKSRVLGPALAPLPQRDEPEQKVGEEPFRALSIIYSSDYENSLGLLIQ